MEKDDDPYEVLGVPYDAEEADIKKAYRKAALKYHPDRQNTEEEKQIAHDVFSKISGAYTILTDPVKRYDWKQANEHKMKGLGGSSSSSSRPATTTSSSSSVRRTSTVTTSTRPSTFAAASPAGTRRTMNSSNMPMKSPGAGMPRQSVVGKSPMQSRASTVRSVGPPPPQARGAGAAGRGSTLTPPGRGRGPAPGRGPAKRDDLRHSMHGTGIRSQQRTIGGTRSDMMNRGSSHLGASMRSVHTTGTGRPQTIRTNSQPGMRPKSPGAIRTPKSPGAIRTPNARRPSSVVSRGRLPAAPSLDDDASVMSSRSLGAGQQRRSSSASPAAGRRQSVQLDRRSAGALRPGRKRPDSTEVQKKCHPPLATYQRLVRQHFGAEYLEQEGKSGFFTKGKEIEAETLEDCDDPLAVTSVSTKTTTEKKDGLYEVKTITKTKRIDGSVESHTETSLVEKEETKNLPKDLNLTVKRKVIMADPKKEDKKKEEEKKKAEKEAKKREAERLKEKKKIAKQNELEERRKAEKKLEDSMMGDSTSFDPSEALQDSTELGESSADLGEDGTKLKKKKKKKKKVKSIEEDQIVDDPELDPSEVLYADDSKEMFMGESSADLEGSFQIGEDGAVIKKKKKKKKKKVVEEGAGDDDAEPEEGKKKKKKKKKKKSEDETEEAEGEENGDDNGDDNGDEE